MYIVDDPLLALITRFMGDSQNVAVSDTEFMIRQINAIEDYVGQFPDSERDKRAIEWIAAHAREYRRQWQKKTIAQTLVKVRCLDCPLTGAHSSLHCEIHTFWLSLLQHYIADDISSQEYVESTLKLLSRYKDRLKVGVARNRLKLATPQLEVA